MLERRGLLKVLCGLVAAPAIVKVADLMPVKSDIVYDPKLRLFSRIEPLTLAVPREFVFMNQVQLFRQYEEQFALEGSRIGDTLRIRLPNDWMDDWANDNSHRSAALPELSAPQVVALGAAAALARNPVASRRQLFFGGVREEGPVASPGSSSSDHPRRNPNQETVA